MGKPSDPVQGTLEPLIMKTIALEHKHGWAIAKRIEQNSRELLRVQQGSLYPALHGLEQRGWIKAKRRETETGRQAKVYSLTAAGRAARRGSRKLEPPLGSDQSGSRDNLVDPAVEPSAAAVITKGARRVRNPFSVPLQPKTDSSRSLDGPVRGSERA